LLVVAPWPGESHLDAGRTMTAIDTVGAWLAAFDGAAERDVAAGALEARRRVSLMVDGDPSIPVIGQPVQRARLSR
jgi:hypothetical protein